jgi:4-carboxymuconolactone decarboxylase
MQMFANHPDLALSFLPFNKHLLQTSPLSPRLRELAVLRVNAYRYSEYQWYHHVELAEREGLSMEQMVAVGQGAEAKVWSDLDRAVIRAVDQLMTTSTLDDAAWKALAKELDDRQIMDLIFTVGCYAFLAPVFNVAGIALEEPYKRYEKMPGPAVPARR